MNWDDILGGAIAGVLAVFITTVTPYLRILTLLFMRKQVFELEWICFTDSILIDLTRLDLFNQDVLEEEHYYTPLESDYFMSNECDFWCVPVAAKRKIYPGSGRVVTSLGQCGDIKLYDRNPLCGKKGGRIGFVFVEWRNNRLIRRFYEGIPEEEKTKIKKKAEYSKAISKWPLNISDVISERMKETGKTLRELIEEERQQKENPGSD